MNKIRGGEGSPWSYNFNHICLLKNSSAPIPALSPSLCPPYSVPWGGGLWFWSRINVQPDPGLQIGLFMVKMQNAERDMLESKRSL